jgi:hypothetical protein
MAYQESMHGGGRRAAGGDLRSGDAAELAMFGVGVLATGAAAAVVLWRLVALLVGGS